MDKITEWTNNNWKILITVFILILIIIDSLKTK